MELKHTICLTMGSWKHKIKVIIKSSHPKKDMDAFYEIGAKKVGFDFVGEVATDPHEHSMPYAKWKMLVDSGCCEDSSDCLEPEDGRVDMWWDQHYLVYLDIVTFGSEGKFHWEEFPMEEIRIGGNGYTEY